MADSGNCSGYFITEAYGFRNESFGCKNGGFGSRTEGYGYRFPCIKRPDGRPDMNWIYKNKGRIPPVNKKLRILPRTISLDFSESEPVHPCYSLVIVGFKRVVGLNCRVQ